MHPSEIRSALARAGLTQRGLADNASVHETVVSAVVRGKSRSKRVEELIAEVTGIPAHQLWPHWYASPVGEAAAARRAVGSVDVQMFGMLEQAMESELLRRRPTVAKPFAIRVRHLCLMYNVLIDRIAPHDNLPSAIRFEVSRYFDGLDDPQGPPLEQLLLRDFSGAQGQTRSVITATGGAMVAGRDNVVGGVKPKRKTK